MPETNTLTTENLSEKPVKKKSKLKKYFRWFLFIFILLAAFSIYWFYFNVFSDGERRGTLIKITRKGNIFKTYEGEMWLSCRQTVNAERFLFSVIDEKVADSLKNLQDQCLQLDYLEYRRSLPWRGDSRYIITGFSRIRE